MTRHKTSSSQVAWALLTEGVTQARVDVHRLRILCDRALSLVESSKERGHLYQVAGDMIQGVPSRISAAERALDRTTYALSLMGEDFLKGRITLGDRDYVDGALMTSPFSSRDKSSTRVARKFLDLGPDRVARRYLSKGNTAESYFVHNPETYEVRQFDKSQALSNKPSIAVNSVRESDSPDRTVSEARSEANKAPPTPTKIENAPGGKDFSTLNRFLIMTEQPGVKGVPESRDEVPKHPKLKPHGGTR